MFDRTALGAFMFGQNFPRARLMTSMGSPASFATSMP